jgi:signal transduction histidine kinase
MRQDRVDTERADHEQGPSRLIRKPSSTPDWLSMSSSVTTRQLVWQAATIDERATLARELHDTVSQSLYGIALGARATRDCLEGAPTRARESIEYVLAMTDRAMDEVRAVILDLRPHALLSVGLQAALSDLTEEVSFRGGPDLSATITTLPPLPETVQVALYRIAAEAVYNAAKHARASRIQLRCGLHRRSVEIGVTDDGIGFDTERAAPGRLGLVSMRERARDVGGELHIRSSRGQGTRVTVRVPLPAP